MFGGYSGPKFCYLWVFKCLPWSFPAGKRPERAKVTTKKPIGNQISAQKAPQTPLKPHLQGVRLPYERLAVILGATVVIWPADVTQGALTAHRGLPEGGGGATRRSRVGRHFVPAVPGRGRRPFTSWLVLVQCDALFACGGYHAVGGRTALCHPIGRSIADGACSKPLSGFMCLVALISASHQKLGT